MTNAQAEKYADKIAKLLRHAEKAGTKEEADTFIEKAQELMEQYSISEALVNQARGDNEKAQEEIVQRDIVITGIYKEALMDVAYAVATMNDCRGVYYKQSAMKAWTRPDGSKVDKRPAAIRLTVTGFESDVRRVEMLYASVSIQCISAQARWVNENKDHLSWMSGMEKFKEKREFVYGFASGLRSQLREAKKRGQEAARAAEEARLKDSGAADADAKKQSSDSVSLVLVSKKQRVDDYMDKSYGKLRSVSSRRSTGSGNARGAGTAAGRSADAGGTGRVGGGRGQLGTGR